MRLDGSNWKRLCKAVDADPNYTPEDVVVDCIMECFKDHRKKNKNITKLLTKVCEDFAKGKLTKAKCEKILNTIK